MLELLRESELRMEGMDIGWYNDRESGVDMWNPDDGKKKETLKKEVPVISKVNVLSEKELFKYTFLNSSLVRRAYGIEKRNGKMELVSDVWMNSTVDIEKVKWIQEICREYNKVEMK